MRRILLAAALLAPPGAAQAQTEPPTVDYVVTPQVGPAGIERIAISLRFQGDADGDTEIALPQRWAGTGELYRAIEGLSVEGGTLGETDEPARRRIAHRPGAAITIRYSIGPSAQDPDAGYEKARPVVRPGWFYIHGEGALATPTGRGEAPARFRWGPAPQGWRWASSLDAPAGPLDVDDLVQSILIGGNDLRVEERAVGGRPLRVALRGRWDFADAAFADRLARIVAAHDEYMQAPASPFFVSLIPLSGAETGAISYGGSGRTDGFALASTANIGLDLFLPLLAHEYGHRWFGRGFGPMPDPEGPDYWFSEGMNDFVAGQVMVRSGLWDPARYAERINEVLLRYASSSARMTSDTDLAQRFWEDQDAMQMPYDRGHLFALALEAQGPVVRPALARMAAARGGAPVGETQAQRFVRAAGLAPDRVAAMRRGDPITLPEALLRPCGAIRWVEQPPYASGYTAEGQADGRYFATVVEGSPAWAAGLRPGMRYLRRISFRSGDSSVPIVMRIGDAAGERVLTWLPRGPGTVRFQRLVLDPDAGAACRARLGGEGG